MRNHLICWEENGTKKWEMVRKKDSSDFLLELIQNPDVTQRTIFITFSRIMERRIRVRR